MCLPFSIEEDAPSHQQHPTYTYGRALYTFGASPTLCGLFILLHFTRHFITITTNHHGKDLRQSIHTHHNSRSTPPTTNHGKRELAPARGLRHRPFDVPRAPGRRHHLSHATLFGVYPSS